LRGSLTKKRAASSSNLNYARIETRTGIGASTLIFDHPLPLVRFRPELASRF